MLLQKKSKVRRLCLPDTENYHKATEIYVGVIATGRDSRLMEQKKKLTYIRNSQK